MKVNIRRRHHNQGQAPGTLEAPKDAAPTEIELFAYNADRIETFKNPPIEKIEALRKEWPMLWINVIGLADLAMIEKLGASFNLHPLALEDVLHSPQRSKVDEYDENIFIIARMIENNGESVSLDQLSLFWGEGYVINFQEHPGDPFKNIRDRLTKVNKRTRMLHADYLGYALLDAAVDDYFPTLEQYGDRIDALEDKILEHASRDLMNELHRTKRDLQLLRFCLWPMRDAISKLRSASGFVSEETMLYLRDCQDHIIQILDIIESYRERISSLNDLYLSSVSNRLNEVMKVLTVVGTIFMPLSFIVGLYGMNFDTHYPYNMPELRQPYGYLAVVAFMIFITIVMLVIFWRAGWIGRRKRVG